MAEELITDEDFMAPLEEEDLAPIVPASPSWQNLNAASQGDPDAYARDLELSNRTGVPVNAVKDNRDEISKRDASSSINEDDWNAPLQDLPNPGTAAYLEDPDAAQVSFDDISILTSIEQEANRPWYDVSTDDFANLGDRMMIGMGKTQDSIAIMTLEGMRRNENWYAMANSQNIAGFALRKAKEAIMMDLPGDTDDETWNAEVDRRIEAHKQNLEFAENLVAELTPENQTVMSEGLTGAVQFVADMAPGLAISAVTRGKVNITLPMLTAKTYQDSYGSAVVAGKDHDVATRYASIDAALEFATEKLPLGRLEKIFGEVGKPGGIKSGIKRWLLEEAGTEQIATLTQTINAYAHELDEELAAAQGPMEVLEIQGRRQAVTLIATIAGGGSMAGSIKGVDYLANRERRAFAKAMEKTNKVRGSEMDQDRLDNLIFMAQSSKTNQRSADQFEKFINKAAPDQVVFMSAEAVDLLNNPPEYLLAQVDGSGGDIAIPLSVFLKDFANDDAKLDLVRPHIKTRENLSTKKEIEEDLDSDYIKTLLAKAAEASETKTAAEQIHEKITAQLIATGRLSAATARQSAALDVAQVTTAYENLKREGKTNPDGSEITLDQLFADIGLEIVGPDADLEAEFMTQGAEVIDDTVTLEDGRTYEKQKTDPDHQVVMVDAELFEDLWVDKVGEGPEYNNQISNRIQHFKNFLEGQDRGTWINPRTGEEVPMKRENIQVGNAYVKGPSPSGGGYLSLGDGRHRARVMLEQGMKKIPISMTSESIEELNKIIASRSGTQDRMAQAEAQGFDTSEVVYHGTGAGRSFDQFETGRAMMSFFTPNQEYAEEYGQTEGYYIRPGKQFDMYNNPEHAQMAMDMFNDRGGWKMAVELNGAEIGEGRTNYNFDPALDLQWEMLDEPETDILSDLVNMGYTTFRFQERDGIPAIGVLNPADIRSVDAAFDPAESSSPRVLAQQDFGNIAVTETVLDESGMPLEISESANAMWAEQKKRQANVAALRRCFNG